MNIPKVVIQQTLNVPSLLLEKTLHLILIPLLIFLFVAFGLLLAKPMLHIEIHALLIPKCLHCIL